MTTNHFNVTATKISCAVNDDAHQIQLIRSKWVLNEKSITLTLYHNEKAIADIYLVNYDEGNEPNQIRSENFNLDAYDELSYQFGLVIDGDAEAIEKIIVMLQDKLPNMTSEHVLTCAKKIDEAMSALSAPSTSPYDYAYELDDGEVVTYSEYIKKEDAEIKHIIQS